MSGQISMTVNTNRQQNAEAQPTATGAATRDRQYS
jgi:hypothetical protein